MWQGAISSQITSVFPRRTDRDRGGGRENRGKRRKCKKENEKEEESLALLPPFLPLNPSHAFERIFSSGKISADDTVVKMKMPQRLVDVTVIGS